jgi:two-component system chemotaxis response regulator CheB
VGSPVTHRILVAEDDEAFLAVLRSLLRADPRFEVCGEARNGRECIELAEELAPDAVVVDIEMPEVDGVEATRAICSWRPDLPVIAISGHDYEERVLEIRAAGACDYVRKARLGDDLPGALTSALAARFAM